MRRGVKAVATALGVLVALIAMVSALTPGAAADQSTQPGVAAAGRIDAGRYQSCAVLPSASLRCWGYGGDGALGYGNTATIGDDETPAGAGPVDLGPGRTAKAISAGTVHTCALLDDDAVRCWGFGGNGRLGLGSTQTVGDDEAPASVGPVNLGPGRTAKAIAAGRAHTCARLDDGAVRCWGFGGDGRLGYNARDSIGDNESPGTAGPVDLGAGRTAKAITAGDAHVCGLLDDGTVRCWGLGANGQLGYGNTEAIGDNETPGSAGPLDLGAGRTAVAISAGDFHTCAVLDDGTVRCWGFGGDGRLGNVNIESIGDNETPAAAGPVNLGPGRTAKAISAGADHTCALLDDNSVRCWGFGQRGALGYANTATIGDDEAPGAAGPVDLGTGRTALAISAGTDHTCARLDDGSVRCWGRSANGELGYCATSSIGDDETPGSAGPVDLGVSGSPGAACAAGPPPEPTPTPTATPTAAPSAEPPVPTSTPPGGEPYELPGTLALRAQARRAASLVGCVMGVERQAWVERSRAGRRRRSRPARRGAQRRLKRRSVRRRGRCKQRFGRTPGRVTELAAGATTAGKVVLTFRAPGSDGQNPPAARTYLIKQSLRPIRNARDFKRAQALCKGTCRFSVTELDAEVTLSITDLRQDRMYYYAVTARDNVSARLGPRSTTVKAKTR